MNLEIFPKPQKVNIEKTFADFSSSKWIIVSAPVSDRLEKQIIEFSKYIAAFTVNVPQVTFANTSELQALIVIKNNAGKKLEEQAYNIRVAKNSITLEASSESGVFYGLQTLKQLFREHSSAIPCCSISDRPDFPDRGIMLDVSRCKVPKMETLFNLIETFAALKINQLQLYIEHTFAYSEHESAWRGFSPFTSQEILELDIFCRERFIELVPNQNSFGHLERWLSHEEYKYIAECPDGHIKTNGSCTGSDSVIAPSPDSLKFLDGLYKEFLPNFKSNFFNIGGDETVELGMGRSKDECLKRGKDKVYFDFLIKIYELVKKHNHKMMFWSDMLIHEVEGHYYPELIKKLPKDIIALEWGYEHDYPFDKEAGVFAKAGIPFYICPCTASWSICGRTKTCVINNASAAENGIKHGAIGFLNTDWGDNGHHQYLSVSYLGFLCGALYSWSYDANKNINLENALNKVFFKDNSGNTAKLFMEMGRLIECFNPNVMYQAYFMNWYDCKFAGAQNFTIPELYACLKKIEELFAAAASMRPGTEDADIIKGEYCNTLRIIKLAIQRILAFKEGFVESDEFHKRAYRKDDVETIADHHRALWIARNRIGGLEASIKYLIK